MNDQSAISSITPSRTSGYFRQPPLAQGIIGLGLLMLLAPSNACAQYAIGVSKHRIPRRLRTVASSVPRSAWSLAVACVTFLMVSSVWAQSVAVSQHLGFDQSYVASTTNMATWWADSPYFDVGIYPNGGVSHANDVNLDAVWAGTAMAQGWGLMPIWSGEQAPCACASYDSNGNCVPFSHTFSTNPDEAEINGGFEATAATEAMGPSVVGLGLSGTIIYYDMENYADKSCADAVVAFLNGWVAGLHAAGFKAGVYGTPADAYDATSGASYSDWTDVSPTPLDDVWLSYIPNQMHDTVTVWNIHSTNANGQLVYEVPDNVWSGSQRMVQYTNFYAPCCSEKWGGVNIATDQSGDIDKDIEDGQVVASTGWIANKQYAFSQHKSFQVGADGTSPYGISGISDAGTYGGTLQPGTLGTLIVGSSYQVVCPGCGDFGFVFLPNSGGLVSQLDLDGTQSTYLTAVNLGGLAAGYDGSGFFTYVTTTDTKNNLPVSCDPNNGCVALGINDAEWVVGAINSNFDNSQGFVYKPEGPQPPPLNLGVWNEISGVNGQGMVTGFYSPDGNNVYGFIADASQSTIQVVQQGIVCPSGYTVRYPGGINNNGQTSGYSEGGGPAAGFFFDPASGNCQNLSSLIIGGQGVAYGLNDFPQIVGQGEGANANIGVVLGPTNQ